MRFFFLHIHFFIFKSKDNGPSHITVATTRPETILADVALAVNSTDSRYSSFIGRRVKHPLLKDRLLPIIADDKVAVDKGTGVLKVVLCETFICDLSLLNMLQVTPCHDPIDFIIGERHKLPLDLCCLDEKGRVTNNFTEYAGIDRCVFT